MPRLAVVDPFCIFPRLFLAYYVEFKRFVSSVFYLCYFNTGILYDIIICSSIKIVNISSIVTSPILCI